MVEIERRILDDGTFRKDITWFLAAIFAKKLHHNAWQSAKYVSLMW